MDVQTSVEGIKTHPVDGSVESWHLKMHNDLSCIAPQDYAAGSAPTEILDEILVQKKATRKSSMFCDYYLFKGTNITNSKVKAIPGQWVKWQNAKEVICCSKIGNYEKNVLRLFRIF